MADSELLHTTQKLGVLTINGEAQTDKPCVFLALPPELRNKIYELALQPPSGYPVLTYNKDGKVVHADSWHEVSLVYVRRYMKKHTCMEKGASR